MYYVLCTLKSEIVLCNVYWYVPIFKTLVLNIDSTNAYCDYHIRFRDIHYNNRPYNIGTTAKNSNTLTDA